MANKRAGEVERQQFRASLSPMDFVNEHVSILGQRGWQRFRLWPAQTDALEMLWRAERCIILKARQLGVTWLALAYALWLMLFCPPCTVLFYSLREQEAKELLGRLEGMHKQLPLYLQLRWMTRHEMELAGSNGSRALSMSSRSGRSYTARFLFVDEADYLPDLNGLLNAAKPTIDNGGQLCLCSTPDRRRPLSVFKNLFRSASESGNGYERIFLPWYAHPGRDARWHKRTLLDMRAQSNHDENFLTEYPMTPEDALSPMTDDKRIPTAWVQRALSATEHSRAVPGGRERSGLRIYRAPQPGAVYLIGADPAEGSERSDDSSAQVVSATPPHEQMAVYAGRAEPSVFAGILAELAAFYNQATIIPERNNHGHALILALSGLGAAVLKGPDDKPGWLTTAQAKTTMYDLLVDQFRAEKVILHDEETAAQLASVELATLSAPAGCHDDCAVSFALAVATSCLHGNTVASTLIPPVDDMAGLWGGKFG